MAAYTQLSSPVDITPIADGAFKDIDVSPYVSNSSGVLIRVKRDAATSTFIARKNGSSVSLLNGFNKGAGQQYLSVGIDANNIFEMSLGASSNPWLVELIGYYNEDDVVFLTDPVNKGGGTNNSWTTLNISANAGSDPTLAAIFHLESGSSQNKVVGLRQLGSSDNRYGTNSVSNGSGTCGHIFTGVDSSGNFQYYHDNYHNKYLIAYFKSGVSMNLNALDISVTSSGAWQSRNIAPGEGAILLFHGAVGSYGARPDDNFNHYAGTCGFNHLGTIVGAIDNNIDIIASTTAIDTFLLGTIDSAIAPTVKSSPLFFGQDF